MRLRQARFETNDLGLFEYYSSQPTARLVRTKLARNVTQCRRPSNPCGFLLNLMQATTYKRQEEKGLRFRVLSQRLFFSDTTSLYFKLFDLQLETLIFKAHHPAFDSWHTSSIRFQLQILQYVSLHHSLPRSFRHSPYRFPRSSDASKSRCHSPLRGSNHERRAFRV